MRWALLVLLLAGCGGGDARVSAPSPGAPVLSGALPYSIVRVSYADQPSPVTDDQLLVLRSLLNTFLTCQSTGRAYPLVEEERITLDLSAAAYRSTCPDGTCTQVIVDQGQDLFPIQTECLAKAPYRGRARLFLLPAGGPVIYVGYGSVSKTFEGQLDRSFGWVSALDFAPEDLFSLPIPHEVGHMLGLPHGDPGVMSGADQAAQRDWEGLYAPHLRRLIGWI